MSGATTSWKQMEVSYQLRVALTKHGFAIWSRLLDGGWICRLEPIGHAPTSGVGGHEFIHQALTAERIDI